MRIRLTKESEGKPGVTAFVRGDGTSTWQKSSDFFAKHDLIHYAVETSLGYHEAFLGLVAQGRELSSFGTQNGLKDTYTQEEIWAEAIVGLFQWPAVRDNNSTEDTELLSVLSQTFEDTDCPPPPLTERHLSEIRKRVQELHSRWDLLQEGETLELEF
jgi:hypothetical protein